MSWVDKPETGLPSKARRMVDYIYFNGHTDPVRQAMADHLEEQFKRVARRAYDRALEVHKIGALDG